MPLPDFTKDEQYLINYVKSTSAAGGSGAYMWTYVISGALIAGFAAYYGSIPMMVAAFVVVCGFRVYEERFQSRCMPMWRSIIAKYEAAASVHSMELESDSDRSG